VNKFFDRYMRLSQVPWLVLGVVGMTIIAAVACRRMGKAMIREARDEAVDTVADETGKTVKRVLVGEKKAETKTKTKETP